MKSLIVCFLILFSYPVNLAAQAPNSLPLNHNCTVYRGFLAGDAAVWKQGIAEQEAIYLKTRDNSDLYVLILSKYGYIGFIIGLKKEEEAKEVIESAEKDVEILASDKRFSARVSAMSGALIAMKISLAPMKAPYLGMKSLRYIEESVEADSNDPAGWVEMGNARFHMPSMFGGSYEEAVKAFSTAVALFEKSSGEMKCNWHYLHALVWLARSNENLNQFEEAKVIYEKILQIEPECLWVKMELYPALLRKRAILPESAFTNLF